MMAAMLKDSPEIRIAKHETARAVDENNQALCDLLNCIYGLGDAGKSQIASFIKEVKDGNGDTRKL